MDWDDPLDPVAVTVDEVANGVRPVLIVMHEEGHGGWQLLDGDDVSERAPRVMPKADVLAIDPSLAAVKDLPVGWQAVRASVNAPWNRSPID
jgi:hypothetical protein